MLELSTRAVYETVATIPSVLEHYSNGIEETVVSKYAGEICLAEKIISHDSNEVLFFVDQTAIKAIQHDQHTISVGEI